MSLLQRIYFIYNLVGHSKIAYKKSIPVITVSGNLKYI